MKPLRITLLLFVFGAGSINSLFEDYKAFEAYKGESYDTSIKYLQVKQIENPHDPELNYNLGVAHFRGAHYVNALKDFERVIEHADEKNPLRVEALYNAGNSLVKETERVLGPDWEAKKVEDKKIDSAVKDLDRAVVRYSQAQVIKEMPNAQQNQAYAEKLIEKLKQKKQQQQQQDKNKDDKKDKDKDKNDKDKDKNQDDKDDGQDSSDGDDKKGNDSPDKKDKKDKGKDKKNKGSKDKDSGKDDKNKNDEKDKADDEEADKEKPKDKGKDNKDKAEESQEDESDKKPGDYKKEKQPEPEGGEKEEGDKPQEPQKGGAAPQEQEQGSDDQSSVSPAGGMEQGQQQDFVYDVLKADDSMEKKAMRALLDDLDEKEAAKQKILMQHQSKSAATSGEVGQKPW